MYIYKDSSKSINERVSDLMSRMSVEQKIDQITCLVTITPDIPNFKEYIPNGIGNVGAFTLADNPEIIAEYTYKLQKFLLEETELGIPALVHCEAAAGAQYTGASVFPSAIAQASTFNMESIYQMAEIIKEQMLAMGFRQALSPVLDITRDPRWGRITETYGEDPTLVSAMGSAFVRGMQGKNKSKGIATTAKHFVGHGVTEGGLNMSRSLISERELYEVHCKPFQAAITEGELMGVMNSYSSIDGEPIACSRKLLTNILRRDLGFSGIVVSDYISIDRIVDPFAVAESYHEAGLKALEAGLDVEYPRPKGYTYEIVQAIEEGRLDENILNLAVQRVLTTKFELGLFENPYPERDLIKSSLNKKTTNEFNENLSRESIILLKNSNELLPLDKEIKNIAVIGPHADSVRSFFSTFSYPAVIDMTSSRDEDGQEFEEPGLIIYDIEQKYPGELRDSSPKIEKQIRNKFKNSKSLFQAISDYLPNSTVKYAKGINCAGSDVSGVEYALSIAAEADVVIMTIGGKSGWGITSTAGEGLDSTNIDLPGKQEEFARKVFALNKKTVVMHFDGRPLSNEYIASHFDSIIEAWQPGEFGGQALTSVLFGDYNPAGRLPVTAARNAGQIPIYYSLPRGSGYVGAGKTGMIRNPFGYINDTAYPLYYFGHGLSYTKFEYKNLVIKKDIVNAGDEVTVCVDIKNIGKYDGDEVVQLYFSDITASMVRPEIELLGFKRLFLKSEETKTIEFKFKVDQIAFLDINMNWKLEAGQIKLMLGASSNDIRLDQKFLIENDAIIDQKKRGFYATAEVL